MCRLDVVDVFGVEVDLRTVAVADVPLAGHDDAEMHLAVVGSQSV